MILDVKNKRICDKLREQKLNNREIRLLLLLCDNEFHEYKECMKWCNIISEHTFFTTISRLKIRCKFLDIQQKFGYGMYKLNSILEIE